MKEFGQSGLEGYCLADSDVFDRIIEDVASDLDTKINPTLLEEYRENLLKGVRGVFGEIRYGDPNYGLLCELEQNVGRFAAFKAYHATEQIKRALNSGKTVEEQTIYARRVLTAFNRYQSAEYNTAVARSRTAKQWADFNDPNTAELFPNLRWLPSRSATPRELHIPYYNKVWAKTDPFWKTNQPGNLWNCKCDWEETSDEPDNKGVEIQDPPVSLAGNPGETGEAFTNKSIYFTAIGNENGDAAILQAGDLAFWEKGTINGADIYVHTLHGHGEIAGNMEVASVFCQRNTGIKSIRLLPDIQEKDSALKRAFYPGGVLPRNEASNADVVVEWVDGRQWVVDFKLMVGSGSTFQKRLRKAYKQADCAVVKLAGIDSTNSTNNETINDILDVAEKFMARHHEFKGIVIYDKDDREILKQLR